MAGCTMIGQSIINVGSGGRTRLSTLASGVFLLGMIMVLGDLVSIIPMGALVAVMFMVAINTFHWSSLPGIIRHPKSETIVMVGTVAVVIVTHNLALGVGVGVVLSTILFSREIAKVIRVTSHLDASARTRTYPWSGRGTGSRHVSRHGTRHGFRHSSRWIVRHAFSSGQESLSRAWLYSGQPRRATVFTKIVIPTDSSASADAALALARERFAEAERCPLHVLDPQRIAASLTSSVSTRDDREAMERNVDERLEALMQPGETHTVKVGLAADDPGAGRPVGADLIVVGTHGRTGLAHFLNGSVAEQVVRHARRSVLIEHEPKA